MNWIKVSKHTFLFFFAIGFFFNSCKTQKGLDSSGFQNEFLGIKDMECVETINPNAIDSKVGTIDCGDISFNYDYGKYSNVGPITAKEEFRRSFDTYHHIKFFEFRMIDPKVYKIFLDSIQVIDVRRKKPDDKLFFDCDPCNTTAEITFMGETYYYPVTLSEDQLNMKGFTCTFEEKGGMVYKYFQVENSLPGLFITPKKNRYKKKNTLSLIVTETTLSKEEVDQILKSVYLK